MFSAPDHNTVFVFYGLKVTLSDTRHAASLTANHSNTGFDLVRSLQLDKGAAILKWAIYCATLANFHLLL